MWTEDPFSSADDYAETLMQQIANVKYQMSNFHSFMIK